MKKLITLICSLMLLAVPAVCYADIPDMPSYEVAGTGINTFALFGIIAVIIVAVVVIVKTVKNKKGR